MRHSWSRRRARKLRSSVSRWRRGGIRLETLEWRDLLTVTFEAQLPIADSDSSYPKSVYAADLDGDGDADLVVASLLIHRVAWFENLDGEGTFGPQRVISDAAVQVASVFVADLDGDGDNDVISGGAGVYDSDVSWYENDGQGNFSEQQVISADVQGTGSVFAADLDGDGDMDVLSASRNDGKVAWYENLDGEGSFGSQELLSADAAGAITVVAADLDGDGDLDVVAGSDSDDSIRWFENGGSGDFSDEFLLTDTAVAVTAVVAADLDDDGDLDIVFTSRDDNTVGWFPNLGPGDDSLEFGPERVISLDDLGPNALYAADLDGDGLLDLAIAGRTGDTVTWHKNLGGGLFDGPRLINNRAEGASGVFAADLDADGDLDLISTSRLDNKVSVYRNEDGLGTFSAEQVLSSQGFLGAQQVDAADVDGDGDLDVVASSFNSDTVSWFENVNGNGTFGPERIISDRVNGAEAVLIADLDGDGDGDAVSASFFDSKLAWYENVDGNGSFGPQRIVSGDSIGLEHVAAADIDGDGDIDLLSVSRADDKIAWYRNIDGLGTFDAQIIVSAALSEPTFVLAADIDGDGDLDILANGYDPENSSLGWFENIDGDGTFGPENLITRDVLLPTAIDTADFDGDGDLDVVVSSGGDDRVIWYENVDGNGDFDEGRLLSDAIDGAFSVRAADFDQDGDMDVVTIALVGDQIVWFENESGQGDFGGEQVIASSVSATTWLSVADLNGDGALDVLVSDTQLSQIIWFRNMNDSTSRRGDFNLDGVVDILDVDRLCGEIQAGGLDDRFDLTGDGSVNSNDLNELIVEVLGTNFGDANLDGIFNSSDFVTAFSAGEYEDDVEGNSTWADGDWNCDGEFTTSDLVFALQAGGYVSGAIPGSHPAAVVPAKGHDDAKPRRA
jgi:hypothetical protein